MRVIIVGAGIGGLTLALALARRGIAATVVERAPALEPVGAGLQLGPNALKVLDRLGVGAAVMAASVGPERAEVRDAATGRLLVVNRLGADAVDRWGAPYRVIRRSALQAALWEAVAAEGVAVRLGAAVKGVVQHDGGVSVALADGAALAGEALVGCDGLHSAVRAAIATPAPPRFTGQTAWRGLAAMPTPAPLRVEVFTGPRSHFVRYPVAEGLVNMVAVTEAAARDGESWDTEGEPAQLAAAFAGWPCVVRDTIAAVARPWRSGLYDRPPLPVWSVGRVTLLGDAAHPMLPFLAQGAAMAIEDAEVLARRLCATDDVAAALRLYQQDRRARTAKVQAWSTRNARLFHLPNAAALSVFGAAQALDRLRGLDGEARFDWLYGWDGWDG